VSKGGCAILLLSSVTVAAVGREVECVANERALGEEDVKVDAFHFQVRDSTVVINDDVLGHWIFRVVKS
jgi:hypothetical protein